jgi:hypothetical protein
MDWQYNGLTQNGQKDKQMPRKQYTENYRLRKTRTQLKPGVNSGDPEG